MPPTNPRKRPAPGAPAVPLHNMDQHFPGSGDPLLRWNPADANAGGFTDGTQGLGSYLPQNHVIPATPSTVLARRQMNRALIPTNPRPQYDAGLDWATLSAGGSGPPMEQSGTGEMNEVETLAQLEVRAQKAKREAEAKRKQIPPFVQKLASFLERGKNQELIRWSEKGDSFIVVDEDEFAKKLIPELFKHNNYASFVRQLNMYGFHKRVGLSDNSMRASERKGKSPNEYENKYFIRGHPNLLWLITKPKNNSKKKGAKNAEGEEDSDDEPAGGDNLAQPAFATAQSGGRALPPSEMSGMPTGGKELMYLRDEFRKIREYQAQILQRMQALEHTQTAIQKEQAAQQQANKRVDEIFRLYSQHEQVMQQMVRVIAFHYNKTHDDSTSQLLKDIMQAGMITGSRGSNQSGVFELNDDFAVPGQSSNPLGAPRKARGLLEAPPSVLGNVDSAPAAVPGLGHGLGTSLEPDNVAELFAASPPELGKVTEIFDTPVETPASTLNLPDHDELLSILGTSAGATPTSHGLGDIPTTTAPNLSQHLPIPPVQATMPSVSAAPPPPAATAAASSPANNFHSSPVPSIPPHLSTQDELETIKQMSDRVGTHLHSVSPLIAPLSPSGRIPGIADGGLEPESYFTGLEHTNDIDWNQWMHDPQGSQNFDHLFNFDQHATDSANTGVGSGSAGGVVTQNENTPSPSGTEEISRDDLLKSPKQTRGTKRRRVN